MIKKIFITYSLFFTIAIFCAPKTTAEKKIDQHARYLKRKAHKSSLPKVRNIYFKHPLLGPYHLALIATPEYIALQQVRAQSHDQCLHLFKANYLPSKISNNRSAYNKIYYAACKRESKALRNTKEYKAYQLHKKELSQLPLNGVGKDDKPINNIDIDDDNDDIISVSNTCITPKLPYKTLSAAATGSII